MRAFVGIDVPAPDLPGLGRPAEASPSHLTLVFFGDIDGAIVPDLVASISRSVEEVDPFLLQLRGLGTFPSDAIPRILFARIADGAGPLATLHGRLLDVARSHRIPVDTRPFVPHLTVLRVRSARDEATVRELRRTHGEATFGSVTVTELLLKSSVLGPGGASHRVEARIPLMEPGRRPPATPGAR